MAERSYNQFCGIARALDIVGERWTLLIIRELLLGPRRFKDLQKGLPGIGTNLLSDRLKKLQRFELLRQRELPPPAASTVYELTPRGEKLRPAVEMLGDWGTQFLDTTGEKELVSPRWLLLILENKFRPQRVGDVEKVIAFDIDGELMYIHIQDGKIETRQGGHPEADLTIRTDTENFLRLVTGKAGPSQDRSELNLHFKGDAELFNNLSRWFDT